MAKNSLSGILDKSKKKSNTVADKHEALKLQIEKWHNTCEYIREKNLPRYHLTWGYALGKRPFPLEGDPDLATVVNVFDEAKSRLIPSLMNIFTENGSQAVAFRLNGLKRKNGTLLEAAVNNTMKRLLFGDFDVYKEMEDCFNESTTTGNGFAKTFMEYKIDKTTVEAEDWLALDDLIQQLQEASQSGDEWEPDLPSGLDEDGQPYTKKGPTPYKNLEWKIGDKAIGGGIDIASGQADVQTAPMMFVRGTINVTRTNKFPKVKQVDLNDLWFDDSCGTNLDESGFIQHRVVMTRAKAIAAGWSKKKIMDAKSADRLDEMPYSKRNIVVDYQSPTFTDEDFGNEASSVDPLEDKINIWETYLRSSLWTGKSELLEVFKTDNDILEVNVIDEMPFVNMMYNPIPGSAWGFSLFEKVQNSQDELSHVARVMKRHMSLSVFNRSIGVKGQFDRQSVLNNRPGAVIEVTGGLQESFMPYPHPQLDPAVATYLQFIRDNADRVVSNSSDSTQGIEKNQQLAAQTVAMMIEQLEMKDKAAAKNIARTGIRPLFRKFYKMLKRERYHIVNEDGSIIPPEALPDDADWVIDFSTVNDVAKQNNTLMTTISTLAQLPDSEFLTASNKAAIADQILGTADLDASRFCTDPASREISPEEQEEQVNAQKAAKETALLNLDLLRGQKSLLTTQIAYEQERVKEAKEEGAAKREREKEKSLREFQKVQSEIKLNEAKTQTEMAKIALQAHTVATEEQTGQDISGLPNVNL